MIEEHTDSSNYELTLTRIYRSFSQLPWLSAWWFVEINFLMFDMNTSLKYTWLYWYLTSLNDKNVQK